MRQLRPARKQAVARVRAGTHDYPPPVPDLFILVYHPLCLQDRHEHVLGTVGHTVPTRGMFSGTILYFRYKVTSRHVASRHVTSRHVTSRHVTSRHVTYNVPAALLSPFYAELLPAPEIREFSRIRSFLGNSTENSTENSVLFQNWSKTPQKASK